MKSYSTAVGVMPLDHMQHRKSAHAAQIFRAVSIRRALLAAIVILAASAPTVSHADSASFQGLGFLPGGYTSSIAYGVNGDGSVVVGNSTSGATDQAFRWTAAGGMVGLGHLSGDTSSGAGAVNSDGSVVVGGSSIASSSTGTAFRWTAAGGMVGLGHLSGDINGDAKGVNGDGSVVVGQSSIHSTTQAFRWTAAGGMVGLGHLSGDTSSTANGVNGDGSVVVGYSGYQAFRWTAAGGMVGLGYLSGNNTSYAYGVNGDGSVIVGYSGSQAFRWTAAGGMVGLGNLSGDTSSNANGVNGDGSVVVGESSHVSGHAVIGQAFRWTADRGMASIKDLLTNAGVNMTGWTLQAANAVSSDGTTTTIVGYGTDPSGNTQAWIARFPIPTRGTLTVDPVHPHNFYGPPGGPFYSGFSGQFTLSNTGQASLNYSISLPYWLTISPLPSSSGSLAGGASVNVVVFPGPAALNASVGNYASAITFMNTTNGAGNTNVVTNLLVTQQPGGSLDPYDNGRSNPPPDAVAGINRPPQLPSGQ